MRVENGRRWRNWGRSETVVPQFAARASSVDDVVDAVRFARDRGVALKAIGAGHSFTGIAVADGVQLDVSGLDGVLAVDGDLVTLGAGTNLYQLPALLAPHGLALENMGDIDRQTIAGAISTGTHGTGARFGGLATQVVAATVVTADGSVLRVSGTENAELLPAVRVGLGALGVLVDVTIRCVPHFMLRAIERPEPLDDVLDDWPRRASGVDHFEFYWWPHTRTALTKSNERLPGDAGRRPQNPVGAWLDDEFLPNGLFVLMCELGVAAPRLIPPLNQLPERLLSVRDVTDSWHPIFTSPRRTKFREMEYALPREHIPAAFRAIRDLIDARGWKITFPLEVRATAADDNWMSTAYGRESGYIAVHRYHREDPTEYFREVEAVMRDFEGRPHWGKMHGRDAADLRPAYPRFDDFLAVRDRLDPDRLFRNDYLKRVLGE